MYIDEGGDTHKGNPALTHVHGEFRYEGLVAQQRQNLAEIVEEAAPLLFGAVHTFAQELTLIGGRFRSEPKIGTQKDLAWALCDQCQHGGRPQSHPAGATQTQATSKGENDSD